MAIKKRRYVIPIYEQHLLLVSTDEANFKQIVEGFNSKIDTSKLEGYAGCAARSVDGSCYAIIMLEKPSISYLAHEIVHIVNMILSHVGVTLDPENDEAQAYLTGYLTQIVFRFFKPKL